MSTSRRGKVPRNPLGPFAPALLCAAASGCTAPGGGDVPPISTDRPGFLFAPTLVPPEHLQVEAGLPALSVTRDAGDELRAWSLPVAVRYGLSERVELRATLPTWTDVRDERGPGVAQDEGFGDVELGAKLALEPLAGGPLALLGSLRLPSGEDGFTSGDPGLSAFLAHGRDLGSAFWLQTLAGVSHLPADDAPDATAATLAALVSHPLAARWSAYAEGTLFPGLRHVAGQAYLGAGLVWQPLDRLQLDLSADFGLDDDAADVVAAFGISWLF